MKIVMAVHHFPPHYTAGAELRTFRTARWMRKNGHDVRVVSVEEIDQGPENGVSWKDDQYLEVPIRRLSFDLRKAPDPKRWEYENPWIEAHLQEYLSEERPDLFHLISGYLMGAGALKAARSLQIPYLITATDYWFMCSRLSFLRSNGELSDPFVSHPQDCVRCRLEESRRYRYLSKFAPKVMDWFWSKALASPGSRPSRYTAMLELYENRDQVLEEMLRSAAAIICPSTFMMEIFSTRGIPPQKLSLITHGLDTSKWLPVAEKPDPAGVVRIGYLGQIDHHKGVHLLIEAFSRLPADVPLELHIYGNPNSAPVYHAYLEKLIKKDARVKMLGKYKNEQVGQILSQMDAVVIPSLWNEIGPWVMFEAFEMKVPVIATNIPNMSCVVSHEQNGLLFERGNATDLANQLRRFTTDESLRRQLAAGIQPVKKIDQEMAELEQVYRSIVPVRA
jgi:glycosyltransferase involved in cell wall biosynthesis